jgi:hypothetical protein
LRLAAHVAVPPALMASALVLPALGFHASVAPAVTFVAPAVSSLKYGKRFMRALGFCILPWFAAYPSNFLSGECVEGPPFEVCAIRPVTSTSSRIRPDHPAGSVRQSNLLCANGIGMDNFVAEKCPSLVMNSSARNTCMGMTIT